MNELFTFFGLAALILLPCYVFGCVMSYCFPSPKQIGLTGLELDRQEAKANGWVLHKKCYEEGREIYVNPEYQCVTSFSIRSSFLGNHDSCYQRKLK